MNILIKYFFICTLIFLSIGCSCKNNAQESLKYGLLYGADYQHRGAVALTGGRYVGLAELLQNNKTEKTREELDWYIDMMIMEIAYSDKNNEPIPDYVKEESTRLIEKANHRRLIAPPELGLKKLAEYRVNNPRIHKNELSEESIILIREFIDKYTGPETEKIIDKYFELMR